MKDFTKVYCSSGVRGLPAVPVLLLELFVQELNFLVTPIRGFLKAVYNGII